MKMGILFPAIEIGNRPDEILEWVQGVERLGYDQVQINGHTLGMDPGRHEKIASPYTHATMFLDPFVVIPFMAAVTSRLDFMTSVLLLPNRQAPLVAKQAADVSVLCGGRLILGVGVGYSAAESAAMGLNFHNRGKRIEEQIEVMRALWRDDSVTFNGRFHEINGLGIAPRPLSPVPVWMGGTAPAVIERVGRMADGFIRGGGTRPEEFPELVSAIRTAVEAAGRDPGTFPIADQLMISSGASDEDWKKYASSAEELGVSHLLVSTVRNGFTTAREHIELAARVYGALT